MIVAAMILALLSAGLHVYIWLLESFWWTSRARAVVGTTAEQAAATRELAFNQGYYNLFLAITTLAGVGFTAFGNPIVGATLMLAGAGSMTAAAVTLLVSDATKRRAAFTQGTLPLLTVVAVLAAILG